MRAQPASVLLALATVSAGLLAGCVGGPSAAEHAARDRLAHVGAALRPEAVRAALPALRADSPSSDFIRYAVLNHPGVVAAYYDWRAALESVGPARALPEPQFTFEADIMDTLMTFMPGLMFDFMAPDKRRAMAAEATATAEVAHRAFVAVVLRTAADTRKAWVELAFIDEATRLRESSVGALEQALGLANTDYTTGRAMGTLANQVRVTNDITKIRTDLATLADRRTAARARLKSTLGLAPTAPDPEWPRASLAATALPAEDELWRRAAAANPELAKMRAMVDMAIAAVSATQASFKPDFTVGGMVDLLADPLMFRPTATIKLPVWREKIAGTIAAAEARRDAAAARVTVEQLNLAAELAQMLYMVRESDRMIAFIDQTALPNFDRTIATIEVGYLSGMTSPGMIPETRLMALNMRLERAAALRERELAVTDLLLMTADLAPAASPLLAQSP